MRRRVDAAVRFALAATLALLLSVLPAAAAEAIRSFTSDVTVGQDGVLTVRETITVNAEGRAIRRGIFRDFPTTYMTAAGTRMRVGFDVLDVKRDGQDEPYAIEGISNGKRVRIGSKDVWLDNGEHTYAITYRTTRQVGFFDNFDEIYWNVTGNGWVFPIEKVTVIVRLPQAARVEDVSLYTGAIGSTASEARVVQNSGNRVVAETTAPLASYEGFTIAVAWQKGVVAPPTAAQLQADWIMDNLGYFGLGLTVLMAALYYLYAWNRVGRDPPGGTIVPLFHPPEGLGAGGVRFVWKHGYDNKAFAAAVVNIAVKGRLKIKDEGGEFTLLRDDRKGEPLTQAESALLAATPRKGIVLEQANHAQISNMRQTLRSNLDDEFDAGIFMHNYGWFIAGLALTAIGLLVSALLLPGDSAGVAAFTVIFTTVWWAIVLSVGASVVRGAFGGGSSLWTRIRHLMGGIFLLPFVAAGVAVPLSTLFGQNLAGSMKWFWGAAILAALFNLVFFYLLKAPTVKGRQLLDQIEGFRLYMTTAEEERLKVLHPPEKTPELFERYLPYAMALDCENEWNTKFAAVLAAAAAAGATAGALGGWYAGNNSFNSRNFGRDLSGSLTSSIASAGTAPGSSSGSFGGGSSGGGGGGGGGGGW